MSVITERFEVEREVGTGGMGTVFRAIDRETGAPVALKVLQKQLHSETERFLLEARVLAQLQHPAIVRYIAHGVTTEGAPFIAMEWLEGEDLWARLQQRVFTVEETVLLARRLAEALASAHAQGIVHRDIKPSNIFLEHGEVGRVKLLDFGVARILDLQRQLTMTGTFLGTPAYTAPEQARGERHVGPEADVFSLGCVLFECLTGRGPFDADNVMAVLTRLLMEQPARLRDHRRDIPEAVATLVERMIIKDPKKRPSNGAAVLTEICSLTWQNANAAAAAAQVAAQQVAAQQVAAQQVAAQQVAAQVAAPYSAAIHTQNSPSVIVSAPEPHSTPAERLARSGLMRRIEESEPKKPASPFESQVTHIQPRLEGGPPPPARPSNAGPVPSKQSPFPSLSSQGQGGPTPSGQSFMPYGQHASRAQPPSNPHPAQQSPHMHQPQQAPHAHQSQQAPHAPPPSHAHQAQQPPSQRAHAHQPQQAPPQPPLQPSNYQPQHPPVVAPPPVPSASRPITARYAPPFAQPAPSVAQPSHTPSHPVNVPAPSGASAVLPTPAPTPPPPAPPAAASPPPSLNRPALLPTLPAPAPAVSHAPPAPAPAPPAISHAPPAASHAPPATSHGRPAAVSQAPSTLVPGAVLPLPPGAHAQPKAPSTSSHASYTQPKPPPTSSNAPYSYPYPGPTGAHPSPTGAHPSPTGPHRAPTGAHPPPTGAHSPRTGAHPPHTGSHDFAGDQSPPTQAVPSRPAPPSSRPGSSQLKRYKLMGFAASLVEHREKPSNLSELSDQVYDLLAKYVSMPWAMMQSHCTRMGKDPYNLHSADLALIADALAKAVTPFAGPKGAAVLLQELRALL